MDKIKQKWDVVVVGAGLTGLTTAYRLSKAEKRVLVIEKNNRVGGQIHTFEKEGYVYESGPNTGVISYPEVRELFDDLKDDCRLEIAKKSAKKRLIWKGNRFHALPSGLWSAVTTPLFTWKDKFRILGEPFRPKGTNPDESVGELARRRLGQSFLDYAVDPFLSGVYAGDPMRLPTRYALPKLYRLEQEHGSFIRGAWVKAREPKSARDRLATKDVFSAEGGLSALTDAMAKAIGSEQILTGVSQLSILPSGSDWQVWIGEGENALSLTASAVVTTTGAYALPAYLSFVDEADLAILTSLTYAPVVQISVGVERSPNPLFEAFGGLVPSKARKKILGILFPSACFKSRCPDGKALYSFFIGGMRYPAISSATDEDLRVLVEEALHDMLGYTDFQIELFEIFRHPHAIPQYEVNSGERFETIHRIEEAYHGLYLGGNMIGGIGMADRIRQANELAARILSSGI